MYTDLLIEQAEQNRNVSGFCERKSNAKYGIKKSTICISSESASKYYGKELGTYIVIDCPKFNDVDSSLHDYVSSYLSHSIQHLIASSKFDTNNTLVVGLGNNSIVSDSFGPMAIKDIIITRHVINQHFKEVDKRLNRVCAISPSVLGKTGIESYDIVKGVVDRIKPSLVIVLDTLVAKNYYRLAKSFQISTSGITPGSGVKNYRPSLNKKSLGVDTMVIGVPMVIEAVSLCSDVAQDIESKQKNIMEDIEQKFYERYENFIVTSKEIDLYVKVCAKIVAKAINKSLHRKLTMEEIDEYMKT